MGDKAGCLKGKSLAQTADSREGIDFFMLSKQKSSRTPLRKKRGSKLPSRPAGTAATKVDRLCSRLNTNVSTNKTSMWYPLRFYTESSQADAAERLTLNCTDLSWDKHPCLLHGWAVSHSAKRASSQRRKRHHRGGIRFHPNSISAQILQHKVDAFSCLGRADRHLRLCWLETSWDCCQRLDRLRSEILSWESWPGWADSVSLTAVVHILEKKAGMDWEHTRPTVIFSTDIKAIWLDFMK